MDLDTIMCESLHSTERRNSSVDVGVAMRDYASCMRVEPMIIDAITLLDRLLFYLGCTNT